MSAHRDALLEAVLPPPVGWPGWGAVDRPAFWRAFRAAAPAHLRLGFALATVVLAVVLPLLLAGRSLRALREPERERLLQRLDRAAALGPLLELAKVVAALCYFDSPATCAVARGRS